MSGTRPADFRTRLISSASRGRTLEIVVPPPDSVEIWVGLRHFMVRELKRERPQTLLIDLRASESVFGTPMLGTFYLAALLMQELGRDRMLRLVARPSVALDLHELLRKAPFPFVEDGWLRVFGGFVHSSIESAMGGEYQKLEDPRILSSAGG